MKKPLIFKKAIYFKVMKTIRNQLNYLTGLRLAVSLKMGVKNFCYSIFMQIQKEQQIDNKQKTSFVLPENAYEDVKPYFCPQTMFICTFIDQQ